MASKNGQSKKKKFWHQKKQNYNKFGPIGMYGNANFTCTPESLCMSILYLGWPWKRFNMGKSTARIGFELETIEYKSETLAKTSQRTKFK